MTGRTSLTIVLAAGEGTRMRSAAAEGAAPGGRPIAAGACAGGGAAGRRRRARGGRRAGPQGGRRRGQARCGRTRRPSCSASGSAPRMRCWRRARRWRRGADDLLVAFGDTPLISAATFERLRAPLRKGATLGRARLSRRRSHRLWPAAGRGRPADGDPRTGRRQRRGARDQALQCRRDGV